MTNLNNLHQKSNYTAGSDHFKDIPFYLTEVNIPGFTLNHIEVGGRAGTKIFKSADTVNWGELSFTMLIDEDFVIFKEVMGIINDNINYETGSFGDFNFDFWLEIQNNKGNTVMKLEFYNCRVSNIGDIILDTQSTETEHQLNIGLVFDYYKIVDDKPIYTLRTTLE